MRTTLPPLLFTLGLAAQAPNLRPPELLPGDRVIGAAVADQRAPAIATGGGVTLLVWDDLRGGDRDVFAVRLDGNGTPLDAVPFLVAGGAGDQSTPVVAWNGTDFLVAWRSQEPTAGYYQNEARAARVSAQGVVRDPVAIAMPGAVEYLVAAANGSDVMVVTEGSTAGTTDLRGFRIDAQGTLRDPQGVVLVPGGTSIRFQLGLAAAGGNWLLTWAENGVVGRRFTANLQPLDAAPVLLLGGPRQVDQPHLASNGSQFVLTTWDNDIYWSQGVACVRFSASLQRLDATPIAVGAQARYQPSATAAWDGTQWVVAWASYPSVRVARVSSAGTVLDPGGLLVEPSATASIYTPVVAGAAGGGAIAVWQDLRNQSTADLYGVRVDGAGNLGAVAAVALGTNEQALPAVAHGGDGYLVVFRSADSATARILAQRVDAFGDVVDVVPLVVGAAIGTSRPAVAFDGQRYLVCWNTGTQVVARRVGVDGAFLDATPFPVMAGGAPDVAGNQGVFLVVNARAASYPQYVDPYAVRVRGSDGAVLDPTPRLVGSSYAVGPRVAALGSGFVVVYEQHWSHNQTSATIVRTLVDANGTVGPAAGVAIVSASAWGAVDVEADGTVALLAWASGSNWVNEDVSVQRLAVDGSLLGSPVTLTANLPSGQSRPAVAFDGERFVVGYESLHANAHFYDRAPDLLCQRVGVDGVVVDAVGVPLWSGAPRDAELAISGGGGGHGLFAASRFTTQGGFASPRIEIRSLVPAGLQDYGVGTPGCGGALRLMATSVPRPGNAAFALLGDRLPANALGLLLLGPVADVPGSDPFGLGALLHVAPAGAAVAAIATDATGRTVVPLPLPALPGLVGSVWNAQIGAVFTGCSPSASGLATSPGLALTIQP